MCILFWNTRLFYVIYFSIYNYRYRLITAIGQDAMYWHQDERRLERLLPEEARKHECIKDLVMLKYVIAKIGRIICLELASMCSDSTTSVLWQQSVHIFGDFLWDVVHSERDANVTIFSSIFHVITQTRRPRLNRKQVIGKCAAILLKYLFAKMSLVQKIASLILYAGHSGKEACRPQHLCLCVHVYCLKHDI